MVAVAHGPGSFTGIRIGSGHRQGPLRGRLDIPAVGVSTLEAMAQSARFVPEADDRLPRHGRAAQPAL